MWILPLAVSGIVGLLSARGFVLGLRHNPGENASKAEWVVGLGVGVLTGAMVFALLR